jgi:hypothetical protein
MANRFKHFGSMQVELRLRAAALIAYKAWQRQFWQGLGFGQPPRRHTHQHFG